MYEAVLKEFPRQPKVWMSYGHSLKTAGRQAESVAAYRRAIAMQPTLGEAYWSLANLKTFRFSDADVLALRNALARVDLADDDRLHFEFALGKALEDDACYEESFAHYASGNAIRRQSHPYSADENTQFVRRSKALFTKDFFAARPGPGHGAGSDLHPRPAARRIDPARADSRQPLARSRGPWSCRIFRRSRASWRAAKGTTTRPRSCRRCLHRRPRSCARSESAISPGRGFCARPTPRFSSTRCRTTSLHVGLIHLILPNAKIIDARRHPLGCGFSGFKQHFARGQNFSYGLEDIGRYYRDYVELMAHFDAVLPGRVHRVFYETMIEDTEAEVRRLLDYCGLPFEDGCLRFYENERAVRTASSEQVRRPIFREGMDHWRHYEPWLDPLKAALGPVLAAYPAVPDSF